MPIRMTVIGGRRDGRTYEFDHTKDAITIGRFDDRDVRFSSKETDISRAHLTIVQVNHRYFLQPEGACYIDGQEVMKDDPLPRHCELALGKPDGVKLRLMWSPPGDMPETTPQVKREPAAGMMRQAVKAQQMAKSSSRRTMGIVAGALVLVVAAVVALVFGTREEPIETALERARPSVYLVIRDDGRGGEAPTGTAWVIAPGTLATNAHVVEPVLQAMAAGRKAYVRSNVPPYDTVEVLAAVQHPHYLALQKEFLKYIPIDASGRNAGFSLGYDVGLLRVAPGAKLAPALKLADASALAALGSGQVAAIVGYPTENLLAGGFNMKTPSAHTHVARITTMTDYFLIPGDADQRHLIHHAIPSAGGSSGSPIFNAKGEVIGLHNAANMFFQPSGDGTVRVPNASLINFGQRADLVLELLENRVPAMDAPRRAYWNKQFAQFKSGPDHLARVFLGSNGQPERKADYEEVVALAAQDKGAVGRTSLDFPGSGYTLLLGHAEDGTSIYFTLSGTDGKSYFQHKTKEAMVYVTVTLKGATTTRVQITGDKPTSVKFRSYYVKAKVE